MSNLILTNEDCMDLLKRTPDKYYDLAICDPPYGIGIDGNKEQRWKDGSLKRKGHELKGWDKSMPSENYFQELFRVSKDQIIWGGNYFTEFLYPTKAWIFWYKGQQDLTMSDGELAWTSLSKVTRMVNIHRTHIWQEKPLHPTQKPVKLYRWLLQNYAKKGDKILDTHLGSMSIAIACDMEGFDLTGCELDPEYYRDGIKRLETFRSQITLDFDK